MRYAALLGIALIASCSSAPPPVPFQGPAPANALDCALGQATMLDYTPLDGGVSSGFIRMIRPTEYTASEAREEVATRVLTMGLAGSNRQESEHITMAGAGGILRITVIGIDEQGKSVRPVPASLARARQIFDACRTPA